MIWALYLLTWQPSNTQTMKWPGFWWPIIILFKMRVVLHHDVCHYPQSGEPTAEVRIWPYSVWEICDDGFDGMIAQIPLQSSNSLHSLLTSQVQEPDRLTSIQWWQLLFAHIVMIKFLLDFSQFFDTFLFKNIHTHTHTYIYIYIAHKIYCVSFMHTCIYTITFYDIFFTQSIWMG